MKHLWVDVVILQGSDIQMNNRLHKVWNLPFQSMTLESLSSKTARKLFLCRNNKTPPFI